MEPSLAQVRAERKGAGMREWLQEACQKIVNNKQ